MTAIRKAHFSSSPKSKRARQRHLKTRRLDRKGFSKRRFSGVTAMNDRTARLRAHKQNIDRYQSLLTTNLSELELQFLQIRLSEERISLAMLEYMSPSGSS